MFEPFNCVKEVMRDNPSCVESLYALFIWARTARGVDAEADSLRIEQFLYSQTEEGNRQRQKDRKHRLGKPKYPRVKEAPSESLSSTLSIN